LFAVSTLFQACDKKEEPKPAATAPAAPAPQTATAQAPQPAPAPEAAPPAQPAPAAAPAQPAAPAAPAKPAVATADGETPGARVEVQELKRVSGGTVMLRFTMINDGDKTLNIGYDFGAGSTSDMGTVGGVHLIEPVGKKKYLVVRDSESKCDCSRGIRDIAAKSRVNLWARFPAPPDNVEKIGVVIPHFSPMDDVPLGR
jgi:nucleoid-associated protein YgaU